MKKNIILLSIILLIGCKCSDNGVDVKKEPMSVIWEINYNDPGGIGIHSMPLILGDSLVIMDGGENILNVYQKSGKIKWEAPIETEFHIQTSVFKTDGERLVGFHAKDIRCWNIDTGEMLWLTKFENEWGNFWMNDMGYLNGKIYQCGWNMYSLDIITGAVDYIRKDNPKCDITIYANKIYSSYSYNNYDSNGGGYTYPSGILMCLLPENGDTIWTRKINNGGGGIDMPPICEDGVVYIGSDEHNPSGVQAFNAETGEEIWHTQIEGTVMFTDGLIVDDLLIMNAGYYHIIALDKNTGEVKYIKFLSQNIVNGRLHYYKGYIYTTRFAWIYVIDPQTGEVVCKTHGGDGQSIYKISVGNDRVFCHGVPKLQCLEIYNPD